MEINLKGSKYFAQFKHIQEESVRHTECKVLKELEKDTTTLGFISIGYARCHPKDNFSKEKGRQLSLTKALEEASFSKEDRKIFWEKYQTWGKERF